MTNKQRIEQLEKQKKKLLNYTHVTILPAEYRTRSLDALASMLHIAHAELQRNCRS